MKKTEFTEAQIALFGTGFSEAFWQQTVAHNFPVLGGAYTFV